jgi:hypothetical protein
MYSTCIGLILRVYHDFENGTYKNSSNNLLHISLEDQNEELPAREMTLEESSFMQEEEERGRKRGRQIGKIFDVNLTDATTTITVINYTVPRAIMVNFIQDGSGGRLITWPTGTKKYLYAVEPTLSPDANAIDSFVFIITAEDTYRIYNVGTGLL